MPAGANLILSLIRRWPPSPWVAGGFVVAAVALGAGGWLIFGGPREPAPAAATASPTPTPDASSKASPTPSPSPSEPPPVAACPLNGLPLSDEGLLAPVPLSVQIENHPLARPARNLSRADMVIEATVEGDATRFTALFLCQHTVGMTGPVRSSRYYNLDVWQDLHVLGYFFGGGTEAIRRFHDAGMPYVNGITGQWPWFRRYGTMPSPHNLYADIEATWPALGKDGVLDGRADAVGDLRPQFSFVRNPTLPVGRPVASVEIRTNSYWRFAWTWDLLSGLWRRSDAGEPISDAATGEPLTARCVVVQKVVETIDYEHHDPGGSPRREHHLIGSGTGTLYVNGQAFDLRWSRPTASDGTSWTYADSGEPVVLPIGVYWWEIIPTYSTVAELAGG